MRVDIRRMDRNRDGYIDPMEREIGIRKEIARLNRRIDTRNCQRGYGYDDYCFRKMAARNPFIQYQQQMALSQNMLLAKIQIAMNNIMNMVRTLMNQQFAQQYGQFDEENYPYGYIPQDTDDIYNRADDPRTLIKGVPARIAAPAVQPQVVAPAVQPQVAATAVQPQVVAPAGQPVPAPAGQPQVAAPAVQPQVVTPAGQPVPAPAAPAAAPQAQVANSDNTNPYDGYYQGADSDAAIYLEQDIANKDSEIANLEKIYQNGDYDRADGGEEKIRAEIQKLKEERAKLADQYDKMQTQPSTASNNVSAPTLSEADRAQVEKNNARINELYDMITSGSIPQNQAQLAMEEIQKLSAENKNLQQPDINSQIASLTKNLGNCDSSQVQGISSQLQNILSQAGIKNDSITEDLQKLNDGNIGETEMDETRTRVAVDIENALNSIKSNS